MLAIVSLLVIVTLSLLVTRAASVALTYTGLSQEAARFQARSAFSGVGYTTSEAEDVVRHPVRRRIVMALMLLGNAGFVTVASAIILTFVSDSGSVAWWLRLAFIFGGLGLLYGFGRIPWVDRKTHQLIEASLRKWTTLEARDFEQLLCLTGDYGVSELVIGTEDWLAHKTLGEAKLDDEGVTVLGIHRGDGTYVGVPTLQTRLQPKDRIIAYGRSGQLAEIDLRCAGDEGDLLHQQACRPTDEAPGSF